MYSATRFVLVAAFISLISVIVSSQANGQYGYYWSGYPSYQSFSVGMGGPVVGYSSYTSYYSPGYSTYYAAPVYGTTVYRAPTAYVTPSYYSTSRVIVPPVVPVVPAYPVYRRPIVPYPPVPIPGPGFRLRYGF